MEARIRPGDLNAVQGRLPRVTPYDRLLLEARFAIQNDRDPRPVLRECYRQAERAMREDRPEAYGTMYGLLACLAEVRYALPRGLDAQDAAARGLRLAKRFTTQEVQTWPDEPRTRLPELGQVFFSLALRGAGAAPEDYRRAGSRLEAILGSNPHLAHRYRSERALLLQRSQPTNGTAS